MIKQNTRDLLNHYINSSKLSAKQKEKMYFNITEYFVEIIHDEENLQYFYKSLFNYIVELPNIKEIEQQLSEVEDKIIMVERSLDKVLEDDDYIEILKDSKKNKRGDNKKALLDLRKEKRILEKKRKDYVDFFHTDFYFLLNNFYYNFELINKNNLFENFLKLNKNDNFITLIIEYAQKNLNLEILKRIVVFYNLNKTQVNTILSYNVIELNILVLKHHETKILKYNDIFNTCFLEDNSFVQELSKLNNKYIVYILNYLKRNSHC